MTELDKNHRLFELPEEQHRLKLPWIASVLIGGESAGRIEIDFEKRRFLLELDGESVIEGYLGSNRIYGEAPGTVVQTYPKDSNTYLHAALVYPKTSDLAGAQAGAFSLKQGKEGIYCDGDVSVQPFRIS